jgi:hypothetical protein
VRNGVLNHELRVSEVLRAVTEEIGNKVSPILPVVGFIHAQIMYGSDKVLDTGGSNSLQDH